MKTALAAVLVLLLLAAAAGAYVYSGSYNIAAGEPHRPLTHYRELAGKAEPHVPGTHSHGAMPHSH